MPHGKSPPRFPAAAVPSIKGLRLSPHGAQASLVNISEKGLLAECDMRLKVGSITKIHFDGSFTPSSVSARVARCEVNGMGPDGALRYHVGIEFDAPIALDRPTAAPSSAADARVDVRESPPPARVVRNRW
jgi:PilZ domain-containing protein